MTAAISMRGLTKTFGSGRSAVTAVDGLDLDIFDGEFLTLLGPSGSGKTTVLRMIAGFELPTSGKILLGGTDVTRVPPFERDVNTVFQDYALFPHMSVQQNVEYGLRAKGVGRVERRTKAREALDGVRLGQYGARRPAELSGGQRQRVALARALVNRPKLLLLDEPLGALDLKLREEMQIELKQIQREVGITFVFVTHDQEEALTMSDRIAVFNAGRAEQVGSPADIYERPSGRFVAGFVGTSNLLGSEVSRAVLGQSGTWSVRPEKIRLTAEGSQVALDEHSAVGTVTEVVYAGVVTRFFVDLDAGASLMVLQQNLRTSAADVSALRGTRATLVWRREHEFQLAPAGPIEVRPTAGRTSTEDHKE